MDYCKIRCIFYSLILIALLLFFAQSYFLSVATGQYKLPKPIVKNISSNLLNKIDSEIEFFRQNLSDFELSNTSISNTNFSLSTTQPDPLCGYFVRSSWGGRLGNQMFVYASFYGMVKKQEKIAKKNAIVQILNPPSEMLLRLDEIFENLSIPQKVIPDSWFSSKNFVILNEAKIFGYDEIGLNRLSCDGKNFLVSGWRSSFRYFDRVFDEIKKEFTFKKSIREECSRLVDDNLIKEGLNRKNCVTVGVHLRRGDFANERQMSYGHWPAQVDFLKKAIRYHEILHFENGTKKIDCLAFLIFGNDYAWNLNASRQVELLRPNNSYLISINSSEAKGEIDMCAFGLCDHAIITTGTFSWWVGFFSRGVVTYQNEFARPGSGHYLEFEPSDLFLSHWIAL